jgi:UDP-3-O-[3-hydroxymyristoyl] glucosamine N-acyltransferase
MILSELISIAKLKSPITLSKTQKEIEIKRVLSIHNPNAKTGDLVFSNQENLAEGAKPSVIITTEKLADFYQKKSLLVLTKSNPRLAFALISKHISPDTLPANIHPNAQIHPSSVIGENVSIGKNTIVDANCTIYNGVKIGESVHISAGCVLGADGFGTEPDETGHYQDITHLGNLVIGNKVSIGANTTIDKATLNEESTHLEEGVKIDNLIQIGHNAYIGKHTVIAAKTGIGGSAHIGENCQIGGMSGVFQGVKITNKVRIVPMSYINKDIAKSGTYRHCRLIQKRN